MLHVEKITRTYHGAEGEVEALKDVSLTVDDGMFVSIIGKSGSGKSTLLSILGALDTPSSGTITVNNTDITRLSGAKQTQYRAQTIGFVFQQYNLISNLTALENVMLALEFGGVPAGERMVRAHELLDEVGIKGAQQHRKPGKPVAVSSSVYQLPERSPITQPSS